MVLSLIIGVAWTLVGFAVAVVLCSVSWGARER